MIVAVLWLAKAKTKQPLVAASYLSSRVECLAPFYIEITSAIIGDFMECNLAGEVPSHGNPGSMENHRRTPWEIAQSWYGAEDIHRAIQCSGSGEFGAWSQIPANVKSREFAEWLTEQYRLAMAKGIQLGRCGSEDYL